LSGNEGAMPGEAVKTELNSEAAAPSGRAITIEQRKRGQARRLAANLRANLQRRKAQARELKAQKVQSEEK